MKKKQKSFCQNPMIFVRKFCIANGHKISYIDLFKLNSTNVSGFLQKELIIGTEDSLFNEIIRSAYN